MVFNKVFFLRPFRGNKRPTLYELVPRNNIRNRDVDSFGAVCHDPPLREAHFRLAVISSNSAVERIYFSKSGGTSRAEEIDGLLVDHLL